MHHHSGSQKQLVKFKYKTLAVSILLLNFPKNKPDPGIKKSLFYTEYSNLSNLFMLQAVVNHSFGTVSRIMTGCGHLKILCFNSGGTILQSF